MSFRIHPMNTGFKKSDKCVHVTGGSCYGEEIEVPAWAFLVTDGKEKILVDTGMCDTRDAGWHHPGSYQPEGFRIDSRLEKLGVRVEEINTVIFTHLHWDHCANMKLFVNAKYLVHAKELAFAVAPHILYHKSYCAGEPGAQSPFDGVEFQTVDGEFQYNSSITLFPTPGHCPGHQSVAVKTDSGIYVIAGDAVVADENLKPDTRRNLPFTPMVRFVNVFELYDSMERIIGRADHVLTGHGEGVGVQPVYP